ncbi:MAG: flagellar biosynthesis anti-sigma factor FlgM [Pirellulales bacterium]|nr:flagellar biosynthesis anti-sigma factor FlgM [Planctomycetales bacterium]
MAETTDRSSRASTPPAVAAADDDVLQRAARIAEIRRQIAAGEYDTAERLDAALAAFLDSDDAVAGDDQRPRRNRPR